LAFRRDRGSCRAGDAFVFVGLAVAAADGRVDLGAHVRARPANACLVARTAARAFLEGTELSLVTGGAAETSTEDVTAVLAGAILRDGDAGHVCGAGVAVGLIVTAANRRVLEGAELGELGADSRLISGATARFVVVETELALAAARADKPAADLGLGTVAAAVLC